MRELSEDLALPVRAGYPEGTGETGGLPRLKEDSPGAALALGGAAWGILPVIRLAADWQG